MEFVLPLETALRLVSDNGGYYNILYTSEVNNILFKLRTTYNVSKIHTDLHVVIFIIMIELDYTYPTSENLSCLINSKHILIKLPFFL